jgi:lysophospholipase L1-like esterase
MTGVPCDDARNADLKAAAAQVRLAVARRAGAPCSLSLPLWEKISQRITGELLATDERLTGKLPATDELLADISRSDGRLANCKLILRWPWQERFHTTSTSILYHYACILYIAVFLTAGSR